MSTDFQASASTVLGIFASSIREFNKQKQRGRCAKNSKNLQPPFALHKPVETIVKPLATSPLNLRAAMPRISDRKSFAAQRQNSTSEPLNCSFADYYSALQPFRIVSQNVTLKQLDLKNEQFTINTEIQLVPMKSDMKTLRFHLGESSRLPNEENGPSDGVVTIQGLPTNYYRINKQLQLGQNPYEKNLRYVKAALKKYYDEYNGDLVVEIPGECAELVFSRKVLTVQICTKVVKPKHGIKFHCYFDSNGTLEEGMHIFTYRSNIFSSTKEWLPCLNGTDQLAVWRFEFEVPKGMTVICTGELTEAIKKQQDDLQVFVYQTSVPVSSDNVGFVIGDLECYVHPELPDLTSYTYPELTSILEHTVSGLPQILSCFEETLSCRFPFPSYKQIFIDNVPEDVISYAGLSIFSINILYHKKILDLVQSTRKTMAMGLATQFFGCFVNASDFKNLWLVKSLARCITGYYIEKSFGTSEYFFEISQLLYYVCDYEKRYGAVILHPLNVDSTSHLHFDPTNPLTCSSLYADVMYKKGQFVLRALQIKLGKESFLKVLNRILVVASEFSRNTENPVDWYHMIISLNSFFATVANITGHEFPTFRDMFIHHGGHAKFKVFSHQNRKRNTIEIEIRQEPAKGKTIYVGPLTICVQELDGYFLHTLQIDANVSKHDVQCHSKARKQRRKKVLLITGEEVDIDLSYIDPESSILWIRVDPDITLLRVIDHTQPVHQLEYMLRYERCAVAQCEAIDQLRHFPVQQVHNVLLEAVENDHFFHRVRNRAAFCLTEICNRLPDGLLPQTNSLMTYFQRVHCSQSDPTIPLQLNFVATTAQLVIITINSELLKFLKNLPHAIGRTRRNGKCPTEVVDFLMGLLKFNDNSINRYSDDHYRAGLINGIASTLTPADLSLKDPSRPDILPQQIDDIVCEVVTALNKDQIQPSYCRVVASSCLQAALLLQRYNYLPADPAVFWAFAQSKSVFIQLRISALRCLATLVSQTHNVGLTDTVMRMFEMLVNDSNPQIRYSLGHILVRKPPFNHSNDITGSLSYPSNTKRLADLMYSMITDLSLEPRIRTYAVDIFYAMYSTVSPLMFLSEEERERLVRERNGLLR
ncbi:Transcription initiation factor TFIID subunit 2 [Aphelenchoides besseyi]|nr:Transcription initiation factor TFIID subunit 2 [Aphelenchoides besseyi]